MASPRMRWMFFLLLLLGLHLLEEIRERRHGRATAHSVGAILARELPDGFLGGGGDMAGPRGRDLLEALQLLGESRVGRAHVDGAGADAEGFVEVLAEGLADGLGALLLQRLEALELLLERAVGGAHVDRGRPALARQVGDGLLRDVGDVDRARLGDLLLLPHHLIESGEGGASVGGTHADRAWRR